MRMEIKFLKILYGLLTLAKRWSGTNPDHLHLCEPSFPQALSQLWSYIWMWLILHCMHCKVIGFGVVTYWYHL